MSDDDNKWYYNLADKTVAQGKVAHAVDRIGPFDTEEEARQALDTVAKRNDLADKQDEEWNN